MVDLNPSVSLIVIVILVLDERVGNLIFVTQNAETTARVKSQLLVLARYVWSNPVNHGSFIVSSVLNDPELTKEWCALLVRYA